MLIYENVLFQPFYICKSFIKKDECYFVQNKVA